MRKSPCGLPSAECWPRPCALPPWLGWRYYHSPYLQAGVTFAEAVRQRIGFSAIGNLPAGQAERHWPTFGIDERVDFTRKPAAGTSHATIVSIPLFPVAACW